MSGFDVEFGNRIQAIGASVLVPVGVRPVDRFEVVRTMGDVRRHVLIVMIGNLVGTHAPLPVGIDVRPPDAAVAYRYP